MDAKSIVNEALSSNHPKISYFPEKHSPVKSCGLSRASTRSIPLSEKHFVTYSLPFNIDKTDRLISDQGLISSKKRLSSSMQRKVRDVSYYKGIVHIKVKEIYEEMRKMQREIDLLSLEHSTYLPYKKKAEIKAAELKNLQNTLANYNIVDDMLNSDMPLNEVIVELKNLKNKNKEENVEVENLFQVKYQREELIKELETDLSQEEHVSEILTTTINPQLREKYARLKCVNDELQSSWLEQERELTKLHDTERALENYLIEDNNVEVLQLLRKLKKLNDQKHSLLSEKTFASVSEEKEYLRKYNVESNDLLKSMKEETKDLVKEIKDTKIELEATSTEVSQLYRERQDKFVKLKKKENAIDDFLSSCSHQQQDVLSELKQHERKVVSLLIEVSSKLGYFNPTMYSLENEQHERFNKKDSEYNLKSQFLKAASDLKEINSFEKKAHEEFRSIKEEIADKEKNVFMHSDIEDLIRNMKKRENELIEEKRLTLKRKQASKFILDDLQQHHDSLVKLLNNLEIHVKLSNLEKKWHLLEEENFSMKNFIESVKHETNYFFIRENVRRIYSELNNLML